MDLSFITENGGIGVKKYLSLILTFMLAFSLAGCGAGNEKANTDSEKKEEKVEKEVESKDQQPDKIVVTDFTGREIELEKPAEKVALLSSGDMDLMMNLGGNIVGRPSSRGEVPEAVKDAEEIGNPHEPNFEKIVSVEADVLIANESFQRHIETVESQGTKVILTSANSVDDIKKQIELYAQILQKEAKGEELIKQIDDQIDALKADKDGNKLKTLLVYGAPGTFLAALPNSLSGNILELAGGENIANEFPKRDDYPNYANLSAEKIIEKDPDIIFLITHGDAEAVKAAFEEEMSQNPAWTNLTAVQKERYVILPSHLFGSNPGMKIVDSITFMSDQLKEAANESN